MSKHRKKPASPGAATANAAREAGKARREATPRKRHAELGDLPPGRDPVAIILASDEGRVAALVPERHTRMLESPFTFYRGTAAIQARDLARAPNSGVEVQCCGDAHLLNFGGFASPERNLVFDLNDFDETHPAPFEWDLKRLSASLVLAARWRSLSEAEAGNIAEAAARSYRHRIALAAGQTTLESWYAAITWEDIRAEVEGEPRMLATVERVIAKAQTRTSESVHHRLTVTTADGLRIRDQPPLLYHLPEVDVPKVAAGFLKSYAGTLREDLRALLARLRFVDAALKVVGVGSVGTRCFVVLMLGEQDEPVYLQIKEARASVLATAGARSPWKNDGERVVAGQRLMQSSSDIFLGWSRGLSGRDFYVRQLRDMKMSLDVAEMRRSGLTAYAVLCGQTLARAHAKAGGAPGIAGYLGRSAAFDGAIRRYALAYADQAEKDYETFRRAAAAGTVRTAAFSQPAEPVVL